MKVKDILFEGISLDTTIKSLVAGFGSPISQLYHAMGSSAIDYYRKNESTSGIKSIVGLQIHRWYQEFYYNRLQKDLFDLAKFAPKHSSDLKEFLNSRPSALEVVDGELPYILLDLSKSIKNESLESVCEKWIQANEQWQSVYRKLIDLERKDMTDYGLVSQKEKRKIKSHSGQVTKTYSPSANARSDEPEYKAPDNSKIAGEQRSAVEAIVNDVLANLPKHVANDIRQSIARSDNKLAALQRELEKHKIQMENVIYSAIVDKNLLFESKNDQVKEIIKTFVAFAKRELELPTLPKINLISDPKFSIKYKSFGGYGDHNISLLIVNRHINDILRTLAHELVHYRQDLNHELHDKSGEDGSEHENEANSMAAVVMRRWGKRYPNLFGFSIL